MPTASGTIGDKPMPKFFYGDDETGRPYGGLMNTEGVPPIESSVTAWILTNRAHTGLWPSHFAVREHLDSKEQRALYAIIRRGWVTQVADGEGRNAVVRYMIPDAEHANGRRRRPPQNLFWRKISEALEPDPVTPLSRTARQILILLIERRDENNRVQLSFADIGRELGIGNDRVFDRMGELQKRGMITKEQSPNRRRASIYTLVEDRLGEYAGVKA